MKKENNFLIEKTVLRSFKIVASSSLGRFKAVFSFVDTNAGDHIERVLVIEFVWECVLFAAYTIAL